MRSLTVGDVFGKLTVLSKTEERKSNEIVWNCVCECGKEKLAKTSHLKNGSVKSCGCLLNVRGRGALGTSGFIKKAKEVHPDIAYDYSKVDYKHSQSPVIIGCPVHEEFTQTPSVHLSGSGCPKCGAIKMGAKHLISEESFLQQAKEKYGDKYDYSEMKYIKCTQKLKIRCTIHDHTFIQSGSYHLIGNEGCKICRGKMFTKDDFIKKSKEIHGEDSYDYSKVQYVASKKKVTLICKQGHEFEQTPHNHTAGKHGCPTCGACGFDPSKESYFYILTDGDMTKIGITNRSAKTRIKTINKTSGKHFKLVAEYNLEGKFCNDLETAMLRMLRKDFKSPCDKFDGFSETFIGLPADDVVEMVECML